MVAKPDAAQQVPKTPPWNDEAAAAIEYDGLPPLAIDSKSKITSKDAVVRFTNVKTVWAKAKDGSIQSSYSASSFGPLGQVVVKSGKIICTGLCTTLEDVANSEIVNLEGGSISPGLVTFGSGLGLREIDSEESTIDGYIFDPLLGKTPSMLNDIEVKAVDGLMFGGRDTL